MAGRGLCRARKLQRIWISLMTVCILVSLVIHRLVSELIIWREDSREPFTPDNVGSFEACDVRAEYNLTACDVECHRKQRVREVVDCAGIIAGDFNAQRKAGRHVDAISSLTISDDMMVTEANNCAHYTSNNYYPSKPLSDSEEDFPIAYTIVAHKDGFQLEKLLQAIYWPQNWYCIHLDKKSSKALTNFVTNLVKCLPHVIVPLKREKVIYGGISRLKADLHCMEELLSRRKTWKYVINLTGQEYPLKTNAEIVGILKTYNGSNDIESVPNSKMPTFEARYRYHWKLKQNNKLVKTKKLKDSPPSNLNLVKGSAFGLFSRAFVEFVTSDALVQQFLYWLSDTWSPDEVFWATLDARFVGPWNKAPGGRRHDDSDAGTWRAKYAVWPDSEDCRGLKVHWSCVFSFRDLPAMVRSKQLFANKFDVHYDYVALACLEQWLHNNTYHIGAAK